MIVLNVNENMILILFDMCQQDISGISTKQMTHMKRRLLYLKLQGALTRLCRRNAILRHIPSLATSDTKHIKRMFWNWSRSLCIQDVDWNQSREITSLLVNESQNSLGSIVLLPPVDVHRGSSRWRLHTTYHKRGL